MFGHPINLSFNNKGESHNTLIGGLCSIVVNIFLLYYFTTLSIRLIGKGDDNIVIAASA